MYEFFQLGSITISHCLLEIQLMINLEFVVLSVAFSCFWKIKLETQADKIDWKKCKTKNFIALSVSSSLIPS